MNSLPESWSLTPLSEISNVKMGQSPDSSSYNEKGEGLPFFQGKAEFGRVYPTVTRWTTNPLRIAEANDILLSVRAPVGPTNLAAERCCIGRGLAAIRADTPLSQKYLFYYFRNIEPWLAQQGTGSTFAGINSHFIRELEVPVAPLNEQKQIVEKLDALLARLDACQTRLDRVRLILDRFRQAVLIAATSGTLTENWREEMGLSLDSWHTKSGAEIFPFITSGSRGWAKYYADSGAMFLMVGNLSHNTIKLDLNEIQYVFLPDTVEGKRTRIEIGDILISITADVGRVALISEDIGEAYVNQHLCLARQSGDYSGSYLAYYLASPLGGLAQLTEVQRGVTKAGVTLGDIKALSLQIPERGEQDEIVRRVEKLFALADRLEARYQIARTQIEHLTPALLTKAFRGGLIPQDPNDEPASVLLERIQAERAAKPERPKRVTTRKPKRIRMTEESVKDAIRQLPEDMFSFDDLRNALAGDYERLKTILFTLLSEADPSISQVFDQSAQAIRFVRSPK